MDFRKVHAANKNVLTLLRMEKCIDSLCEATFLYTFDAKSEYFRVKITKSDQKKSVFVSHHVVYPLPWMLFGLRNSPGTFKRSMDVPVLTVKGQLALFCLDDIDALSSSPAEPIYHVKHALTLLRRVEVAWS